MACRHVHGTTGSPPPGIPHTPPRRPRWTVRARSPSRTVADAHAAPPAAGQATASAAFLSPQQPNPVVVPSTPPLLRVLRRPLEPGLAAVVGVTDQAGGWLPLADGHIQGIQDQLGTQVLGH